MLAVRHLVWLASYAEQYARNVEFSLEGSGFPCFKGVSARSMP